MQETTFYEYWISMDPGKLDDFRSFLGFMNYKRIPVVQGDYYIMEGGGSTARIEPPAAGANKFGVKFSFAGSMPYRDKVKSELAKREFAFEVFKDQAVAPR